MAASTIYKPNTSKGPVVLTPAEGPRTPPVITLPDGSKVTGRYYNTNEGRHQFIFPPQVTQYQDLKVDYNGQQGTIADGRTSYEGSSTGNWQARQKGSLPGATGGDANGDGVADQFAPGQVGAGSYPAYQNYPSPTFASFNSIQAAPYKFTRPIKFAKRFAKFNRNQINKNFEQAQDLGFKELEAELQGLQSFAPAAAALQRSEIAKDNPFNQGQAADMSRFAREEATKTNAFNETSATRANQFARSEIPLTNQFNRSQAIDTNTFARSEIAKTNPFNQAQRTQQLDTALPGVRGQLAAQGGRAETFAGGRLTNDIEDRAFEVGVRSRAADASSAGGFGAQSSVARKSSALLSAEQRLNLSKYGDSLLGQNINQRANLELAPTEYAKTEVNPTEYQKTEVNPTEYTKSIIPDLQISNAGSQIQVMPSVDAGTRIANSLTELNRNTLLDPATALNSKVQQNQFTTNLEQRTREFNATGQYNASATNAGIANSFAQGSFAYDAGYAGTVAGAAQTDTNTQAALDQQAAAQDTFEDNKAATQNANDVGSAATVVAAATPGIVTAIDNAFASTDEGAGSENSILGPEPTFDYYGTQSTPSSTSPTPDYSSDTPVAIPDTSTPDFSLDAASTDSGDFSLRSAELSSGTLPSGGPTPVTNLQDIAASLKNSVGGSNLQSFARDTGVTIGTTGSPAETVSDLEALNTSSEAVLKTAGITYAPTKGSVHSGFDKNGNPIFSNVALLRSNNAAAGADFVDLTASLAAPFSVVTGEDEERLKELGSKASDSEVIEKLDSLRSKGDVKGFMKLLGKHMELVGRLPGVANA